MDVCHPPIPIVFFFKVDPALTTSWQRETKTDAQTYPPTRDKHQTHSPPPPNTENPQWPMEYCTTVRPRRVCQHWKTCAPIHSESTQNLGRKTEQVLQEPTGENRQDWQHYPTTNILLVSMETFFEDPLPQENVDYQYTGTNPPLILCINANDNF